MMATVAAQRRVPTLDPRHRIRTAVLPPVRALRLRAPAGQPTRACDDRQGTPGSGVPRRGLLLAGVAASPLLPMLQARAGAAPREAPVADVPMARLKLPAGALGAGYALVPISVGGVGPIEFMLDSGLTGELVSPHLRMALQLRGSGGAPVAGLGAGGATSPGELVTLEGAEIGGLPLPPLPAIVAPFPQEHLDPGHDPVEGMLGMEFLSLFDADLDFLAGRLRLWRPGAARAVADRAGLAEVPAAVINDTGLLGIRVVPSTPSGKQQQPILGIVDCGASFSVVNWAGAAAMGLPPRGDPSYASRPGVSVLGVDGKPFTLGTTQLGLDFAGEPFKRPGGAGLGFAPPPPGWVAWDPVDAGVGDMPVFGQLLGDGKGSAFRGPAALLGLDIWAQRRVVFEAANGQSRRRRLYIAMR